VILLVEAGERSLPPRDGCFCAVAGFRSVVAAAHDPQYRLLIVVPAAMDNRYSPSSLP
jgi:hypothetical protein